MVLAQINRGMGCLVVVFLRPFCFIGEILPYFNPFNRVFTNPINLSQLPLGQNTRVMLGIRINRSNVGFFGILQFAG